MKKKIITVIYIIALLLVLLAFQMFVINDKAFRMNYVVEREDVKNVFGFMNSNKLGYSFDFPRSLLMKEDGTYADYIDFVPIDASGYVCNRVRYSIIYQ